MFPFYNQIYVWHKYNKTFYRKKSFSSQHICSKLLWNISLTFFFTNVYLMSWTWSMLVSNEHLYKVQWKHISHTHMWNEQNCKAVILFLYFISCKAYDSKYKYIKTTEKHKFLSLVYMMPVDIILCLRHYVLWRFGQNNKTWWSSCMTGMYFVRAT